MTYIIKFVDIADETRNVASSVSTSLLNHRALFNSVGIPYYKATQTHHHYGRVNGSPAIIAEWAVDCDDGDLFLMKLKANFTETKL